MHRKVKFETETKEKILFKVSNFIWSHLMSFLNFAEKSKTFFSCIIFIYSDLIPSVYYQFKYFLLQFYLEFVQSAVKRKSPVRGFYSRMSSHHNQFNSSFISRSVRIFNFLFILKNLLLPSYYTLNDWFSSFEYINERMFFFKTIWRIEWKTYSSKWNKLL
jgi:hypothetical protein